jgi:hypothetical protein
VTERDPDDVLREAFQALGDGSRGSGGCPAPEQIWQAATGEADAATVRALVEHTTTCRACAEDWRLARGLEETRRAETTGVGQAATAVERKGTHGSRAVLAIAASAVLALAGVVYVAQRTVEPRGSGLRDGRSQAIRSLLAAEEVMPRDRCRLAWSGAPQGSRYDVIVTTESLDPVLEARDLEKDEVIVPAADLNPAASGRLLWRVEATLPDGSRIVSPTFSTRCHEAP